ncbi:MAG TPA: PmoA family protein, partial [Microbacterium sp.]|nr:PmoA family protein [Microbacterium sp.]
MFVDDSAPGRLIVRDGASVLLDCVYAPTDAAIESPRPYALLRTRDGVDVTSHRPADHVWHKGLSLAIANLGDHNFWGGPTYVSGRGYVQLPNNGAQVHRAFRAITTDAAGVVCIDEELDWVAASGAVVLTERRTLTVRDSHDDAWALTWRSALRNATRDALAFGSPTTQGRPDAGYGGIFWRGPAAFTGGELVSPHGVIGDAACGEPASWLALTARDRSAGIVMLDAADPGAPWFARSAEYAGLGPAPFFH